MEHRNTPFDPPSPYLVSNTYLIGEQDLVASEGRKSKTLDYMFYRIE